MATEFKLPELGENIKAGDVIRLLIKPGDSVTNDQPVLELETDKATIEVPSTVAGKVTDVKVKAGDKVKVGQTIFVVEDTKEAKDSKEAKEQEPSRGPKPQPQGAPEEGGLSQKATPQERPTPERAPAPSHAEGRAAASAQRLPEDEVEEQEPEQEAARPERVEGRQKRGEVVDISRAPRAAAQAAPAAEQGPAPAAAPSVRRVARELGVDIRQVAGTGPSGRITVDDVQAFVRQAMQGGRAIPAGAAAPSVVEGQPLPDFSKWGDVERKPMSNIRRKTSEHLGHAWNVIPHVTQHDKADITALEELRKKYGPQAERAGGKLTVTAIALKVLAGAVRKFPQFAASIDPQRGQLVYKKYTHIGVAVDTDRGLLVPVIRDVDTKGIVELSAELAKASEKARAGKLSLDEMSGGVITITNLGGIGGVGFTPIVNWPEVAILGISRGSYEPVWNGSSFEPRLMLPLSLSYDHRIIDGADAARFVRWVAEAFEQPFVLAL
jgi:pyruvate dehydrogenase E2 component (dihydrolipoyllysine-residue acetyltransferase)